MQADGVTSAPQCSVLILRGTGREVAAALDALLGPRSAPCVRQYKAGRMLLLPAADCSTLCCCLVCPKAALVFPPVHLDGKLFRGTTQRSLLQRTTLLHIFSCRISVSGELV